MTLCRILFRKQGNRMKRLIFVALIAIIGCDSANKELSPPKSPDLQLTDKTNPWFQSSISELEKKRLAAKKIQNQMGAANEFI